MRITRHLLAALAALLLSACGTAPGSDTGLHHYAVQASGVATVTRRYVQDGVDCVDLRWQADNNIGEPAVFNAIALRTIVGLPHPDAVAAGDRLRLGVTHRVEQRGSTTPVITASRWVAEQRPTPAGERHTGH